jgi:hypothetical protein
MKWRKDVGEHAMIEALEERRLMSDTVGSLAAESDTSAAKEQFTRTKPHVNISCYVPGSSSGDGGYVFATDGKASGI